MARVVSHPMLITLSKRAFVYLESQGKINITRLSSYTDIVTNFPPKLVTSGYRGVNGV